MRSRILIATLTVVAISLLSHSQVQAKMLHNFDCAECHKAGAVWNSVGGEGYTSSTDAAGANICLQCHGSAAKTMALNTDLQAVLDMGPPIRVITTPVPDPDSPATPVGTFSVGDASNKLGSNGSAVDQTSHNWGASIYNPRAGSANNPADTMYNKTTASRQGSAGHVTCFRCHDPHGAKSVPRVADNNKLLRFPGYNKSDPATMAPTPEKVESTCVVCHADWAGVLQTENALESHPLVSDYPTFQGANSDRYKVFAPNGEMKLLNGAAKIGCTTCHGLHNTDSNAGTVDGPGVTGGDGALLLGDGPSRSSSAVCNSCHVYQMHPSSSGTPIGCLDCHSGHSYNDGTPNYYILRSEFDVPAGSSLPTAGTKVTGLRFTSDPDTTPTNELWAGTGGSTGYCENCHGDVTNNAVGGVSQNRTHTEGEDCSACHSHYNPANPGNSFTPVNCDGCHGFPPTAAVAGGPNGYAVNGGNDYSTGGTFVFPYKNESQTGHITHASGGGNYTFTCDNCHGAGANTSGHSGHDSGTFQEVFQLADAPLPNLTTDSGSMTPNYNTTGSGTCSAVYCHSNGGPRGAAPTPATIPAWENALGQITTCDACHGNTTATMGTSGNSSTHAAHLDKGYACGVCHSQTATTNTNLLAAAIGGAGTHVNGTPDILADMSQAGLGGTITYATDGTCQNVYCHSDGSGTYSTPDWDLPASGACGTCHAIDGTLPDAHATHFAASGPNITDCSVCHTHNGSGADHVNGSYDVQANACLGCHGAVAAGTGNDSEPTWTLPASVTCENCHIGVLSTLPAADTKYLVDVTAPAKDTFLTVGHGDSGLSSPRTCTDCHDATDIGHFDLTSGDDNRLLTLGATTYGTGTETAWCQECHTTIFPHFDNNKTSGGSSSNGHQCYICHEPHGEGVGAGFDAMLLTDVGAGTNITGFTNRNAAGSYFNAGTTGVCQVCHDQNEVSHYHRNNVGGEPSGDGHNSTTACITCHQHGSNPAFQGGNCFDCHGDTVAEYWPQSVGTNDRTQDAVSDFNDDGRHTAHVTAIASEVMGQNIAQLLTDNAGVGNAPYDTMTSDAKQKAICGYCHVVGDGDHASLNSGFAEVFPVGGKKKIWDGSNDADASFTTVNFSCSTVDCHDSKTTTDTVGDDYTWYGADSSACIMCHDDITDGGTPNTTGSTHQAHLGAATNYGINTITCDTCHDAAANWATNTPPAAGHRDGAWTLDAFTYSVSYPASGGNCGTNFCHNDGTGSGPPKDGTIAWATDIANPNCGICHDEVMATRKHTPHLNNDTFVPTIVSGITNRECDNCHGIDPEEQTTHINLSVEKANRITSYSLGNTCANACHNDDAADDWVAGGSLNCTDCHGSGKDTTTFAVGGAALDRGWPPAQGAHGVHVANTSYVAASCVDCHNNNTAGHSVINGTITSPTLGAKISAWDGAVGQKNCTNTCHVANKAPDWTGGARDCMDCHTGTYIGGGANAPASGLHTGTLTVSGNTHDDSFSDGNAGTATCESCHTATPSSAHIDGTFTNTAPTINFAAAVNFTDGATPTCGPNGGLVNCHDDGGAWSRKWSATAQNSDGTECANCHGTFDLGFVSGMALRHQADVQLEANHQGNAPVNDCRLCHAYGHTNYTAGMHRDGTIQLNATKVGFVDNGATVGCGSCHLSNDGTADGQHEFQDVNNGDGLGFDRWGRQDIAGDDADCSSCHNSNITGGRHAGGTTESLATHDLHNASPYIDADASWDPVNSNGTTWNDCTTCHPHNGSGAAHNNGTVNFNNTNISNTYDYAHSPGEFGGTCGTTNGCHDADGTGEWNAGNLGADACADCHGSTSATFFEAQVAGMDLTWQASPAGPTTPKHPEHLGNTVYVTTSCTACHGALAATGGHLGHKNKAVDNAVTYVSATQTCTNTCHTADTSGDWTVAGALACTDCHGGGGSVDAGNDAWASVDTPDGKHGTHAGAYTYGATGQTATGAGTTYDFGCGECHAGTHLNGPTVASIEVTVANWASATSSCGTNACHNDGAAGPPNAAGNGQLNWGVAFTGDRCAKCHGNIPGTGAHTAHQVGIHWQDVYTGTTGLLGAGVEPAGHGGQTTGGAPTSTVINCQVCHFSTVTDWFNDQNPTCSTAGCHTNGVPGQGNVTIAQRQNHITGSTDDGQAEVTFFGSAVRSKAQLRNDIESIAEIGTNWDRYNDGIIQALFYKNTNAFDQTANSLNAGGASYTQGAPSTCTTQCHNGNAAQWVAPSGDCSACHTALPQ